MLGTNVGLYDGRTGAAIKQIVAAEPIKGQFGRMMLERSSRITALAFSPDGRWLLTGGADTTVRIWEVATGGEALRLEGHEGDVTELTFSSDMRSIFSAANDAQAYLWSARPKGIKAGKSTEGWWDDLAGLDAAKAYRAIWAVSESPTTAAALLRERIVPVKAVDQGRLDQWITDLDSDKFAVREAASKALSALGELAGPSLEKALKAGPTLETRQRLEKLLTANRLQHDPTPGELRTLRAVQAMELAGTSEASATLRAWAGGAAGHHLTEAARTALARLKSREQAPATK
jgi:hypothetical protein